MTQANVTGQCSNCHTMHNSQGGTAMAVAGSGLGWDAGGDLGGTPQESPNKTLLVTDCIGCHTSTSAETIIESGGSRIPIVYNTVLPTKPLAGGNFYWVAQGDNSKGHNVKGISPEDSLSQAPGFLSGCNGSCHKSLSADLTADGATLAAVYGWQNGCTGCHMIGMNDMTSWHHLNDGTGTKLVDSKTKGWYRFLKGHFSGVNNGVAGIEDEDWEKTATSSVHNEYLGSAGNKTSPGSFSVMGANTMTAFCTGCHGNIHKQDTTSTGASPWIRHPSDAAILNSGEYANAFGAAGSGTGAYDPDVPVARTSLSSVSNTVALGTDLVMCLSCHRAHGSPYNKMMRWDYESTNLATALSGCNVCHTSKN